MNYKELNFKCGLEIHQQIEGHKLFCKCHTIIQDEEPSFTFTRKLRASASELGQIDIAALHELKKGKYFVYNFYNGSNCLVDMDEEPPNELNKDALEIAIQVSLLLHCKINNVVQFMRKVVIDGSNVSGFQRTALIATNGYIETSKGKVSLPTVYLEEEAAKKVESKEQYNVYNISRLGIPLIEIDTGTEIKDPEHAKETAEKIGMVLRSVKGIKRGLGTIRQDVNVSIKNGSRIEIKGFQDYRNIPKVLDYEINRQLEMINKNEKVISEVRSARSDFTTRFERPMPGANRMYLETDVPLIFIDKNYLNKIKLPELISEKIESLEEENINPDIARQLVKENKLDLFKKLIKIYPEKQIVANTLILAVKDIKSRLNLDVNKLKDSDFEFVFKSLSENKINKNSISNLLVDVIKDEEIDFNNYKGLSDKQLELEIKKIIKDNPNANVSALMGIVMGRYRGLVSGKKVMEILQKLKQ